LALYVKEAFDIKEYCQKCEECARQRRSKNRATLLSLLPAAGPFERLGLDFVRPIHSTSYKGNNYILVITDYFTLLLYQLITTRPIPNTSLYVELLAGVSHNPTLTFFTMKSNCLQESRTITTPGVAVVYSIASPSSTCLALHLRGFFRELSQTMVTRLCDNDPLAFPGISPREN
jgi:hypothetical protein